MQILLKITSKERLKFRKRLTFAFKQLLTNSSWYAEEFNIRISEQDLATGIESVIRKDKLYNTNYANIRNNHMDELIC